MAGDLPFTESHLGSKLDVQTGKGYGSRPVGGSTMLPHTSVRESTGRSESQLLVLIAHRDVDAFDELYERANPMVHGVIGRLVRDRFQAEEVAQEVMLQIWQNADTFNPRLGNGRAWILQLARSRAIDRIRMCERDRSRDHHYRTQQEWAQVGVDVAGSVLRGVDAAVIHQALLGLTAPQREVLVLAFFGNLSYPQIADTLDAPLGTVKTRIRDGLKRLRTALDATDTDERAA